jgi:tetratricopeptide (TPR) repeat protein
MAPLGRVRQQQLLREAEGYLELISFFPEQITLDPPHRVCLTDRALDCLRQVHGHWSERAKLLYLKGQAYRISDRLDRAVEALERSYLLDSRNIQTCLALGWCYKRLKRLDDAIESLRSALVIDPNSALAHYNLACYFSLAGRVKPAVHHLAAALEIDGSFRDSIAGETDFDPIRDDPAFVEAISQVA